MASGSVTGREGGDTGSVHGEKPMLERQLPEKNVLIIPTGIENIQGEKKERCFLVRKTITC